MKLVFDLDGVIASYDFPTIFEKYLGIKGITEGMLTEYCVSNCLGIPDSDINKLFDRAARDPLIVENDVTYFLNELSKKNEIYIWTARFKFETHDQIEKQLNDANITFDGLIENLDFSVDAVIDDSVSKLLSAQSFCKHLFLFSRPWNFNCLNIRQSFQWIVNWDGIYEVLTKLGA